MKNMFGKWENILILRMIIIENTLIIIDEECYMFKKPISVEIIENFSVKSN